MPCTFDPEHEEFGVKYFWIASHLKPETQEHKKF